MAGVKEIQDRIKSIQDTRKITNAMYLISSSKLKKAKKRHDETAPYFDMLKSTIAAIIEHTPSFEHRFFDERENKAVRNEGYLIITGDKGLCGSYNHNVIKLAEEHISKNNNNTLFAVGQMGRKYFAKKGITVDEEFLYTAQNPNIHRSGAISETLIKLFEEGYLDDIYLIYTKSISPIKCEPQIMKILPLERHSFNGGGHDRYKQTTTFSPSVDVVMDHLVPNYVRGVIFGALIESFSSEQNSRMMAMDAATKSADDMLAALSLEYNRARQAAITQEMNEIVGGSQSLS